MGRAPRLHLPRAGPARRRGARGRCSRPTPSSCISAAKAGVRPSLADPVGYARANVDRHGRGGRGGADGRGVSRFVFGSSSSVYGDSTPVPFREDATAAEPVSPYAATKRAAELLLHSVAPVYGFRVASLRFFTVYGPRQRPDLAIHAFTRRMVEGRTVTLFGDGTQSRDYTYCDDIVAGVVAAVDWTATAPVGVEHVQSRRQPTGPHRRDGGGDRPGARDQAADRVGPDAAGRRAAHGRRPDQVGRGARLRAADAVSGGDPTLRRLVPGGLWPLRLTACSRGRSDRFAVQDYYGAVHLLEEIVAGGRAFADVHHLLGVSLSLLGQRSARWREFAPRAGAQPALPRGADPPGPGAERAGPGARRPTSRSAGRRPAWRRPSSGLPAPWRPGSPTSTRSWPRPTPRPARSTGRSSNTSARSSWVPPSTDLRYRMARLLLESGRALEAREALEEVLAARPNFVDAAAALGLAHYLSGDALGARDVWKAVSRCDVPRTSGWRPIWRCSAEPTA